MGKKNKKTNFKKIPSQEFFAGTQSVPDRENIWRPSQGLQRKNEDRVSHNPGIGSKTTGVAPSCEIDIPLNDGSITQSAASQAVHVSCNNVTMEDPPTAVTGQMTKLDITCPSVDQTGVGLNVEAAEFRPTETFTSSYASVSCSTSCPPSTSSRKWNSQPSGGLKPSLGDGSGYPMQQSSTFSNPTTHSDRNNTSDMYKLGGSNNARNFKNQSHIHQKEITRDSYNPLQKQDHSVQHGTTHTQENYEDIIGDSDSESAANYASSRSKKCRTSETSVDDEKSLQELNKEYLGAKSTESSDSNNGKPSYRSKSRERSKPEKRHEYGSDSYNKKGKAGDNYPESRDRRDGSKIHRSEGNNKMTEGKQKNRTKSPNRKEKSNYEDKYSGRDNRAHEAETSRSKSNNTEEKSKAQDHCYQSQDGQYESKSYTQQDVSHNRPDSRDSNRRNKYDSARSDDQNSRNNFSQDNPWQEAKGGRNRGPQHQRKPQTSRLEPPFDRQSQIDKSGYNDSKKNNQVSGSQTYKTVDSPSDKVSTKPEYEKGSENVVVQGSFQNCSFDTNESIDNWRSHTRQSLDGYDSDKKHKMGMIQRKSLGDERNTQKLRDPRMERGSMHWRNTPRTDDPEYEAFCEILRRDEEVKYIKVQEISGDLFEMPKEYSLGHCVAEDLSMGSGIAVQFK
nr:unnamed protein product [Callosobruchus chinensis]